MPEKVSRDASLDALGIAMVSMGVMQVEAANISVGILLVVCGLIAIVAKYVLRVRAESD